MKQRLALVVLVLGGCYHAPTSWRVEGLEPIGWQDIMAAAKARATCNIKAWGGVIKVYSAPFMYEGGLVWGCNPANDEIRIVGAPLLPLAKDGALGEEACHDWLYICNQDGTEPPAKACAAAVRAQFP